MFSIKIAVCKLRRLLFRRIFLYKLYKRYRNKQRMNKGVSRENKFSAFSNPPISYHSLVKLVLTTFYIMSKQSRN